MKRAVLTILSTIITVLSAFAQLPTLPSSQLSPNATSLGEYGEVPVSLFSGIPQIEIPLYTIEAGDHQVPISLSYHGGGVKVDQHPGWTGLGWTLMAGGSISRTVNDAPDEYNNTTCNVVTYGNPAEMGYLWQHSMNGFNWDDPSLVNNYLRYYGDTYFETKDTEPDKFSFNFLGYSGIFYMDHNGNWKVQCDKDVKVELGKVTDTGELTDSFTMIYNQHTDDFLHHGMIDGCSLMTNIGNFGRSPSIKSFTLTAEDGTKYIFGGIDDAIEFSLDYFAQDQAQIVATSWNLIKIKYPDGREVEFNYQRGDFEAQFYQYQTYKSYSGGKTSFWWILPDQETDGQYRYSSGKAYGGNLIFPSYLESIRSNAGVVNFYRGESTELKYDYSRIKDRYEMTMASNSSSPIYAYLYPILRLNGSYSGDYTHATEALKWQQLKSISIFGSDVSSPAIKRFVFEYSDNPNVRLTLNSVAVDDYDPQNNNSGVGGKYTFEYNCVDSLPAYCSWHTDHWGYYNGKTHEDDIRSTQYYGKRNPDSVKSAFGSLSKITYPTGGYTRFVYEPNDYSFAVSEDHIGVENISGQAGGLRVKEIRNSASGSANDEYPAKRYIYKTGYSPSGQGASSGALLNRIRYQYDPYYMTNVSGSQNTMSMYHSASIIPAMDCFGGACVGYSEVTEVMTDNSYTTYKFSNIDNGALDAGADASIQNHTIFEPYSTKSQERGLLLKKTEYDSSGNRVGTSSYVYEKDDTTSNNFVRSMRINTVQGVNSAANVAIEGTAYRLYTYSMRQVAQYDTIFDGSQAFATRTITEYNPHKLVKKIVRTVGPGIDEITSLKYPMDRNDEKFPQMTAAHIFSPLVEKIVTRYDNSTSTTLNVNKQFNHYKSNMVKPSSISEALDNNGYHTADSLGYDNYFNTICHARYGVPQSRFLWSYKGLYPVAFTEGNEYPVLGSTMAVFTDSLSFNRILNASSLKSLSLCEYTPFGKVSKTTSRTGDTLYYYYDLIGRLKYSRNSDGRMLDLYNYHYSTDNSADNFNYLTKTEFITPVMHSATPNVTLSNSVTDTGYFDGLGRKLQTVSVGAATSGGDIADYTEYDASGSPVRQWLPAVGSGSGAFTPLSSLQYSGAYGGGSYSDFHTQVSYENRPSHRPTEVRQAGTDWLNADGTRTYYKINTSAANGELTAMWLRLTSSGGLEKAGTYPAGNLLVTKTVDEDGCPLWTFTDKAGNKVLERRQPDTTLPSYADTYFVYDNQGNVRYAISPEGSKLIAGYANGEINASDNAIVLYSYTYQYDHRNRLYGKKRPGIMPENFLFDNLDRVRFSNDGNHNIAGRWIATEYDRYNRVAYTADFATTKTYSQLRSSVLQTNENVALTEGSALGNGKIFGYSVTDANSQNGGNFTADDVISVNYYDDYGFLSNFATSGDELAAVKSRLDYQAMTGYGTKSASARAAYGLTTGTVRRVLWPEGMEQPASAPLTKKYVFAASYYDCHGRLIQSRETNLLGGQENYYYDLSFTGKPLRVRHEHVTADTTITETTTYTYDNRDRLVATAHNFGNDTPTTLQSDQLDALGRVATRHLGGNGSADALTTVAYGYDLHGNVSSITSDQFSQTLRRERRGDNSVGLLNGDICEQEFTLHYQKPDNSADRYEGKFRYTYDGMDRLTYATTTSFSHKHKDSAFPGYGIVLNANAPQYSERVGYDLNSNITSFSRRGYKRTLSAGKDYGLLDSLTVYYGGNQVRMVTDAVTTDYGHPAEYCDGAATWYEHNHDKNGNLVCDLDRGVSSIGYNVLNLPESVVFTGNHETYNIYDADGRKLRTIHIVAYDPVMLPSGETITPTDTLVRDYSGSHIYENGALERTLTPTGYYASADSQYCYYIKDYQGNNIAVVTDVNGSAKAVSATLMYPFGGELTEMSATDRYRFGGKELDTRGGLFHYDFGARCYDPVLPMFNGYDRMAEKYCHLSPFAYCAGNPIRYIDPSGEVITICGEVYDPNKDYSDASEFVQNIVYALQLSSKYGSEELVDDLINSKNTYDFTLSTDDKSYTNFEKGSNSATVYLRDGGTNFVVNNAIHEEMHLAQIENGQGGETVYNEIEAFAFQNIVINNSRPNDKSVISSVSDIFKEQQMNDVFLRIGEQDYSVIGSGIQIFRQTITGKKPEYRDIKEYPIGYKKNLLQHYNIKDR